MGSAQIKPRAAVSDPGLNTQQNKSNLKIGDRVVWWDDENGKEGHPEAGTVRWRGFLDSISKTQVVAGIEFDNELKLGSGWHNEYQVFTCKRGHGAFIYEHGLVLEKDFNDGKHEPMRWEDESTVSTAESKPPWMPPKIIAAPLSAPQLSSNHHPEIIDPMGFVDRNRNLEAAHTGDSLPPCPGNGRAQSDAGHDRIQQANGSSSKPEVPNRSEEVPMDLGAGERITQSPPPQPCSSKRGLSTDDCGSDLDRSSRQKKEQKTQRPPQPVSHQLQSSTSKSRPPPRQPNPQIPPAMHPPPFVLTPPWTRETYNNMTPGLRFYKGIQGFQNSCYLDSSLFSMYTFLQIFDGCITAVPDRVKDDPPALNLHEVRASLRRIVNQLRDPRTQAVPSSTVFQLREHIACLDPKFTTEEMDSQEFLQHLFKRIFHLPEFLRMSNGQDDYFHQILLPAPGAQEMNIPTVLIPSLQELLVQSFQFQNLKLSQAPNPVLIVQLPRDQKSKQFNLVLPTQTLDVTELYETPPPEGAPNVLNLFAVICIESNHFVSFVRVPKSTSQKPKPTDCVNINGEGGGGGSDDKKTEHEYDPWVLFDSMYLRKDVMTPCVEKLPYMGKWLDELDDSLPISEDLMREINEHPRLVHLKRLLHDAYMCFYTA